MKIAFLASEAVPFSKTGGLADVAGALPRALEAMGLEPFVIVPLHRSAAKTFEPHVEAPHRPIVPIGGRTFEARVFQSVLPKSSVPVYLIDQPAFFQRAGIYQSGGVDHHDNFERFLFFSRAALETMRLMDLRPDIIHANDWQTGLVPLYLERMYRSRPGFEATGTLLTVHNLAYQGAFPGHAMGLTGLDWSLFNWRELEFHGKVNCLKAGLVFADRISTVSPTYALEIQSPRFGCGLDGLLRDRKDDLRGIVNGIDTSTWNPSADAMIAARYDRETYASGKAACKAQLQRRADLPERPDVPLFAQIGRLDPQKGWDILADFAEDFLRKDVQLVILGEGQPRYHELLDRLADAHPGKLRAFLEFSNPLAHQIEAGADFFLMPSLYEPCGLNQLYSLAYGTIPIVHCVGGLADTVVDADAANLKAGQANGFVFREPTPRALAEGIDRALAAWGDQETRRRLITAAMRADWSWDQSAARYAALYREICSIRTARAAS